MVDIHSHILPKIDDGSKNLSMTYEMLRKCSKEGVKKNCGNTTLLRL